MSVFFTKKPVSIIALLTLSLCLNIKAQLIHHNLHVKLSINEKTVEVLDSMQIPENVLKASSAINFYLNPAFKPVPLNKDAELSEVPAKSIKGKPDPDAPKEYKLSFKTKNSNGLAILHYKGKIEDEIKTEANDLVKGFSDTRGIISDKGVYLYGGTYWVPAFDSLLVTFNLSVEPDHGFGLITQGTRIINTPKEIRYKCETPADEVFLVAGKWFEFNKTTKNNVLVQAELLTNDTALAMKYVDATESYINMYEELIGKYPYTKFSLVENFWETGFGMPSFTLLGEKVIRLPFILFSSYPHELLHNYWGNSVFVSSRGGNWCEGLTSYLADHLLKEQMGQGSEYRRSVLQKYTDYVNESNDFPVSKFTSRHNPVEEAVGYGKVTMIFDMLRLEAGDNNFKSALSLFYKDNIYKHASFTDIRNSFEKVLKKDLKPFFDEWVNRTGAPKLKLSNVNVKPQGTNYALSFSISQEQKTKPYQLKVPVVISLEGQDSSVVKMIDLQKPSENFSLNFDKKPVKIEVDPYFNVFRVLDPNEVPVSISKIQGEKKSAIILPKNSKFSAGYSDLAKEWQENQKLLGNTVTVYYDSDLTKLPSEASWIIGYENKFAPDSTYTELIRSVMPEEIFKQLTSYRNTGSIVYTFNKEGKARGFLASSNEKAIPLLKRKITHYGKFGYLAFEGEKAENKLKGEFPVSNSPLQHSFFNQNTNNQKNILKNRTALVKLQ